VFVQGEQRFVREVGLPPCALAGRDLRHKQDLEAGKFYSLARTTTVLHSGSLLQIKDVTATEMKLVDSLKELFKTMRSIMRSRLDHLVPEWDRWEFLTNWEGLSIEEKNDKYNEFCGH
jgi:hypothetical protein